MIGLLGGTKFESLAITNDQFRAIQRVYGYVPEQPGQRPVPPAPPPPCPADASRQEYVAHQKAVEAHKKIVGECARWQNPQAFMQAGADRNALRSAQADGMRLMAWLAKYTEPGEDPVKVLIRMASASGHEVDPEEYEWATSEGAEEEKDILAAD